MNMQASRRDVLKGSGALIVSFSLGGSCAVRSAVASVMPSSMTLSQLRAVYALARGPRFTFSSRGSITS